MPDPRKSIDTLHGSEYASMLIATRIPFSVKYEIEFQTSFYVDPDDEDEAWALMMRLRGSKLG